MDIIDKKKETEKKLKRMKNKRRIAYGKRIKCKRENKQRECYSMLILLVT